MIYHLVAGDMAGAPLKEALVNDAGLREEVVVMRDLLHLGPLKRAEGQSFSAMREAFWQEVAINDKLPVAIDDLERLLEVSTALNNSDDAQAWVWMAPWPTDVCLYHWVLEYLGKHLGRLYVVNIANLPFLNEDGKVFYPKNLSEVLPKEILKARRLARQVTPAELEIDGEEWRRLISEDAGIRTHEGGKKLLSRDEHYYDDKLLSFCSQQFQKASRIVGQSLTKYNIPTGDVYLGWRLRKLAGEGKLLLNGDISKTLKDYEVKLPGDAATDTVGIP